MDSRTLQSTPESGARAGFDRHKKRKGSRVHAAMDTLGHLLALMVTPANEQDRAQVGQLTQAIQTAVAEPVQVAFVDQGYTGEQPAATAAQAGIKLEVVKHYEAKHGFVLLPRSQYGLNLLKEHPYAVDFILHMIPVGNKRRQSAEQIVLCVTLLDSKDQMIAANPLVSTPHVAAGQTLELSIFIPTDANISPPKCRVRVSLVRWTGE